MSCLTLEQIDQLARNALDGETAAALQAHLDHCEPCRRKVEQAREDERLLGKLKDLPENAAAPSMDSASPLDPTAPASRPGGVRPPHFSSPPPDSFAGYQIIREVHRGGQGVVYQAVQKSTKRKVAIKVMKEGPFASRGDKARFEREVEVLGQLNHPNIVSVHDSGQAAGSFYFVMDYISGQPLDVWMAGRERSVEETLRLFQKICEAVHAAHLKGIIHRDLKPGNIRIDDGGEPYVLDFGLAKVAHGAEEASLMTMTGQFMGSLPWASPEQAEAKPGKIDMRTDVYSLGVVLYQMLTGKFPYDVVGNMRDVLDRIMKAEPARPSTFRMASPRRKAVAADALVGRRDPVALAPRGQRGSQGASTPSRSRRGSRIPNRINDEVDTIVLKCLSKERERRYQSAGELARDIGHYLTGEPIEAKRDSGLYLLKKALRRYRAPMAMAAAIALALVLGLAGTTWQAGVARRNAQRESTARARWEAEAGRALAAEAEAQRQRDAATEAARQSELRQCDALISEGDALRASSNFELAYARYAEAGDALARLGASRRRLDLSLAGLFGDSPPPIWTIPPDAHSREGIGVSPDGRRAVFVNEDGIASIVDLRTLTTVMTLSEGPYQKNYPAWSPDSTLVFLAMRNFGLHVRESATGALVSDLRGHDKPIYSIVAARDRSIAVSRDAGNTIIIWDLAAGKMRHRINPGVDVRKIALSPDAATLAVACTDEQPCLWDCVTGDPLISPTPLQGVERDVEMRRSENGLTAVEFDPAGNSIVGGTTVGELIRFDIAQGRHSFSASKRFVPERHTARVNDIVFAGPSVVYTASADRTIREWHTNAKGQWSQGRVFVGHVEPVWSLSVSGDVAVSRSRDGSVRLWPLASPPPVAPIFLDPIAVSPNGSLAAGCIGRSEMAVVHLASGRALAAFDVGSHPWGCAFAHDNRTLLTSDVSGAVVVWDSATGQRRGQLLAHQVESYDVEVSEDGELAASCGFDGRVYVYNTSDWSLMRTLRAAKPLAALTFAPGQPRVLLAGAEGMTSGEVYLWNLETGEELSRWSVGASVRDIRFSPDGSLVAIASAHHDVALFDATSALSGRPVEVRRFRGHGRTVSVCVFSADGQTLYTGGMDATIRSWDVPSGRQLTTFDLPQNLRRNAMATTGDCSALLFAYGKPIHLAAPASFRESEAVLSRASADLTAPRAPERLAALARAYAQRGARGWAVELGDEAIGLGQLVDAAELAAWRLASEDTPDVGIPSSPASNGGERNTALASLLFGSAARLPLPALEPPGPASGAPSAPSHSVSPGASGADDKRGSKKRAASSRPASPGSIAASDTPKLRQAMDTDVVVEGTVVSAAWSRSGKVLNIEFRDAETDGLLALVFSKDRPAFDQAFNGDFAGAILKRNVRLKGKIALYAGYVDSLKGRPQMTLSDPAQIEIVDDSPAKAP